MINNIRVLIVEDDDQTAANLRDCLEDRTEVHYDVDLVSTRSQALEKLDKEHYDAVLLDLFLPDGSGVPLVKDITAAADKKNVGLVVLTGWGREFESTVRAAGAKEYLTKPIDVSEISKRLQYVVIDRRHAAQRHEIESALQKLADPNVFG